MKHLQKAMDILSLILLVVLSVVAITTQPLNGYALASMLLAYGLVLVIAYMHKDRKDKYFLSLMRCEMLLIMLCVTWSHAIQVFQPLTILLLACMFGSTWSMDYLLNEKA